MNHSQKERDSRVERAFMVQVNQDPSVEPPRWDIVTAQNISASGVLFNFNRYIEPGTRIGLRVALPLNHTLECEGEVIRNVTADGLEAGSDNDCVSAVAADFAGMSEEEHEEVRVFFEEHLFGNPIYTSVISEDEQPETS